MRAARTVFFIAGLYGVAALAPGLLLEGQVPQMGMPAIVNPEYYYGFIGSALVWQCAFFLIASDPGRYRPLMLIAALEKFAFFFTCLFLYGVGRMALSPPFYGAMIDGALMLAFLWVWRGMRPGR